jgi:hypothetical protein
MSWRGMGRLLLRSRLMIDGCDANFFYPLFSVCGWSFIDTWRAFFVIVAWSGLDRRDGRVRRWGLCIMYITTTKNSNL